jgi:hypothetical protein
VNKTVLISPNVYVNKITNKVYYISSSSNSISGVSSFATDSTGKCICTNVVTKVVHDIFMLNETITSYNISYYLEDFSATCSSTEYIPVNYIVNFKGTTVIKIILILMIFRIKIICDLETQAI